MKKILILLLALALFFVPFGSAFAYTGGLLHGKGLYRSADVNTIPSNTFLDLTDGNEATAYSLGASGNAADTIWYEFTGTATIEAYQLKADSFAGVNIYFYGIDGNLIDAETKDQIYVNGVKKLLSSSPDVGKSLSGVKKVALVNTGTSTRNIYEFDVFGSVAEPSTKTNVLSGKTFIVGGNHTEQNGTTPRLGDGSIATPYTMGANGTTNDTLWYEFSQPINMSGYKLSASGNVSLYYIDSSLNIKTISLSPNVSFSDVALNKTDIKKIYIHNNTSGNISVNEFELYADELTEPEIVHDELSNLTLAASHEKVDLAWSIPSNNPDFTGTKIYRNGTFLTSVNSSTKTFADADVSAETNYTYKITAVYSDGHETAGVSKSVTTKSPPPTDRDGDGIPDSEDEYPDDPTNTPPDRDGDGIPDSEDEYPDDPTNTPPSIEVKNLEIKTTYKSANLSWVLPKTDALQHVNIYRDTLTEETSFMDKLINVKKAYAASEKIFETNGTYFNDYTVKPGTDYEYTVTTTSVDGVESQGVTATTKTPGKPAIAFEELSLPFSVKDLITSGNGLLWIIGPFILLALAFLIVPKLRNLIIGAFRKESKVSSEASERRTKAEAIQKMESQEAKEKRTDREPKSERVEVAPKPIREPKELKQPRIREPQERTRTPKLSRERIREPRASRASRETREPRERTRKTRDRRGIS